MTDEKEKIWKKWFSLYNEKMLSKEEYLGNLYDIGYDKPEAHVIRKQDTLYYAFYADSWEGEIELRGLKEDRNYILINFFDKIKLGEISSSNPHVDVTFKDFLLIEVVPTAD